MLVGTVALSAQWDASPYRGTPGGRAIPRYQYRGVAHCATRLKPAGEEPASISPPPSKKFLKCMQKLPDPLLFANKVFNPVLGGVLAPDT